MAPSSSSSSPLPSTADHPPPGNLETEIQPYFVLHRGSAIQTCNVKCSIAKTRANAYVDPQESADDYFLRLSMQAFDVFWPEIESTIKDVLRNINTSVFKLVHRWVHESFQATRSWRSPSAIESMRSYPVISDISHRRLFTGLIFTKNMEFVDDVLTFQELGLHLKFEGCHVAHLSSIDFSAKCGIGGCLRSLLRQFLNVTLDAADISILASWYNEQQGSSNPLVIVVEDMEKCYGPVLSELILMLSEWTLKLPVTLVIGVATTPDAPKSILSSDALQRLHAFKFMLGSPSERMDAIVEAVLLGPWFSVGHKVALFLRKYFLKLDGSLTSFTRALKISCVQHFSTEPLSFLLQDFAREDDSKHVWCKNPAFPMDEALKYACRLPSCQKMTEPTSSNLTHGLAELKRLRNCWIAGIRHRLEAGKHKKIQLLDLYCEALDPHPFESRSPDNHLRSKRANEMLPLNSECVPGQYAGFSNSVPTSQGCKVRDYTRSMECLPFHEVICFKDVDKLQSALLGDPRRRIQADLLTSEEFLRCSCCCGRGNMLSSSLHDTSIMYLLAKEHGDVINLHDWYQSFKTTVTGPATKGKLRPKQSAPKKSKRADDSGNVNEAAVQARFCRAVTELQLLGMVRTPSRRRRDYVQSIAFGLKP
ncbi:Origin recognition complex subunit 3 [Dionaea muscipula]